MNLDDGFRVYDPTPESCAWATAAACVAAKLLATPGVPLRHGGTWFVGVDALPNASDGTLCGVPLKGPWMQDIDGAPPWHPGQLSVVYPGYPGRDPGESDAAHRYRHRRYAAHVDGLSLVKALRAAFKSR